MANAVITGWTFSRTAMDNFIEFAINREMLESVLSEPEKVLPADHGRQRFFGGNITVVVNAVLKQIIAISTHEYVDEETRAYRREEFAKLAEEQREALLAQDIPFVRARPPLVRKVAPSPVVARQMPTPAEVYRKPAEPRSEEPPRSFDECTVAQYAAYWEREYLRMGLTCEPSDPSSSPPDSRDS